MNLSPDAETAVRLALSKVRERALRAEEAADLDAAIAELMSVRDACIGAAITIRGVSERTRADALSKLETVA